MSRVLKANSEAAWQQQLEQLARYCGWKTYHAPDNRPVQTRSGRRYVQNVAAGWPDLVLVRPPELLIVELKTDKGRVAPEQTAWLEALAACGLETYVWRPRDLDDARARLNATVGNGA